MFKLMHFSGSVKQHFKEKKNKKYLTQRVILILYRRAGTELPERNFFLAWAGGTLNSSFAAGATTPGRCAQFAAINPG